MWEYVAREISYDPMRRKKWTELETIYAIERIMINWGGESRLKEATFIVVNERRPASPDFQVWSPLGPFYRYAHDDLDNHQEWVEADARNHFVWHATYLNIFPEGTQFPTPDEVGIQAGDGQDDDDDGNDDPSNGADGNLNMEVDEEEDPEEDPNWNAPPVIANVGANPDQNSLPVNPIVWRDIHEVNANPNGNERNSLVERTMEEYEISEESRARIRRMMEEARRDVTRETVERDMEEHRRRADTYFGTGWNNGEGPSNDNSEQAPRRRRMTTREYLNLFVRVGDGGSDYRDEPATPPP